MSNLITMIRRITFSLCLVMASNCFAQDSMSEQEDGAIRGKGWVIDLDSGSVLYDGTNTEEYSQEESNNESAIRTKGSGIEFIIGGQGKDGIAKKGSLPVYD